MSKSGVDRTGVRFVLSNCSEPAQVDEYNKWYDSYGADCTKLGLLVSAIRFENPDAASTDADPRFLTIYDIVTPDPGQAWPLTAERQHRLYPEIPDYFSVALAGTYAVVSSVDRSTNGETTGVTIVMSDANDSSLEVFAAALMETGIFSRATDFTLVEGFPGQPPDRLVVLETADAKPLSAYTRAREAAGAKEPATRYGASFRLQSSYP